MVAVALLRCWRRSLLPSKKVGISSSELLSISAPIAIAAIGENEIRRHRRFCLPQYLDRSTRQWHAMIALRLHALAGDCPNGGVKVDLGPLRADHFRHSRLPSKCKTPMPAPTPSPPSVVDSQGLQGNFVFHCTLWFTRKAGLTSFPLRPLLAAGGGSALLSRYLFLDALQARAGGL